MDLLSVSRGSIVAPAGCGKTQLIADALSRYKDGRPILVLTHTNAGVSALRARLAAHGVAGRSVRIATVDGWAMRLARAFPDRARMTAAEVNAARPNYRRFREGALEIVRGGHIDAPLRATYGQLIVDEYQDCSSLQHAIVSAVSQSLRVCVLGDPLQAIFGFDPADPLPPWGEVTAEFPIVGKLDVPWRWKRCGMDRLGGWLLAVRDQLERGRQVDLRSSPPEVEWIELSGSESDHVLCLKVISKTYDEHSGSSLVICDGRRVSRRSEIAREVPGAVTVEAVDLRDLLDFAATFTPSAEDSLEYLLQFAASLQTGVDAAGLLTRIAALRGARARKPADRCEEAALAFLETRTPAAARQLLIALDERPGTRVFRPHMLRMTLDALELWHRYPDTGFEAAAVAVRERQRLRGRPIGKRAVGSTLLLKGLETEAVVILDGDRMDARNLYVALTRGSHRIVVCSKSPLLP